MTQPQEGRSRADIHVVRRLLRLSLRYRRRVTAAFLLQVLFIGLTLIGLGLTGLTVDVLLWELKSAAPEPRWPLGLAPPGTWSTTAVLLTLGGAVLGISLLRGLASYAYSVQIARLVHLEVVPELRTELYDKLQRLSLRFFDAHSSGSIINRVTRDVQLLRSFIDGVVVQGAVLGLTLGCFLGFMLNRHVTLTLASLAGAPLLYLATVIFVRLVEPAYRDERRLSDRLVRTMTESIEGIQIIKIFGRESERRASFSTQNQALYDRQLGIFESVSRFSPTIDLLGQLSIVTLLAYGGWLVSRAALTLGDLVVFIGLLQQFSSRVSEMAGIANTLQQSITGARRVFEILDAPSEIESPQRGSDLGASSTAPELCFEKVSFGYGPTLVLDHLSFRVASGRCLAITGATGSGKSTLLQLVLRFYDPTEGLITAWGRDLRELDLDRLRQHIGIVFQESFLFRDTVAANIAFGHPGATREQIERAARLASAHDFIQRLEHGYDTRLEEGALELSGGERQRLSIARALLLDPPILLLDDPTASIDPITADQVIEAISGATRGRTTLIVSSHPRVLASADEILVLKRGRLAGLHSRHDEPEPSEPVFELLP